VLAAVARGPLPIGPNRPLVQHRVPQARLEPVLEQRALAAGVHDHLRAHLFGQAAFLLDADAAGTAAVEEHVEDAGALVNLNAVLLGVAEHEQVELATNDLPRLRALVRLVVPEVERRRLPAAGADKL